MFSALPVPILLPAVIFAVFAVLDWHRLPVVARVCLGAATACLLAGIQQPLATVEELVAHEDGLAYLVALGRVLGAGAVLFSVTLTLRELSTR